MKERGWCLIAQVSTPLNSGCICRVVEPYVPDRILRLLSDVSWRYKMQCLLLSILLKIHMLLTKVHGLINLHCSCMINSRFYNIKRKKRNLKNPVSLSMMFLDPFSTPLPAFASASASFSLQCHNLLWLLWSLDQVLGTQARTTTPDYWLGFLHDLIYVSFSSCCCSDSNIVHIITSVILHGSLFCQGKYRLTCTFLISFW